MFFASLPPPSSVSSVVLPISSSFSLSGFVFLLKAPHSSLKEPQGWPGAASRGCGETLSKALLPCNHWRGLYCGGRRERTSGRIVIRGGGGGQERGRERVACLPRIHFQDSSSYRPPSLPLPPPLAFCVTFDPERKTADCAAAAFALDRPTD